ncbi:MAG TPA: DUF6125 family protein [Dehalococcoidia bacterium]|nr:DUF6125 family protein [Dehalococcoidia bacterium]
MKKPEDKEAAAEIDLKLEDLPRESLVGLVRLYSRLMMDIDGLWFLSMKDRISNEEAIACDNWVWGRVVKKMLDDLAGLIGVQGRDVVDFMRVIQATPLHYVVEETIEVQNRNRATLTVTYCPTLAALEKEDAGRDTLHCRLACSVTRTRHAKLFNPAIEVECLTMPPRKDKQGLFCCWEYRIG